MQWSRYLPYTLLVGEHSWWVVPRILSALLREVELLLGTYHLCYSRIGPVLQRRYLVSYQNPRTERVWLARRMLGNWCIGKAYYDRAGCRTQDLTIPNHGGDSKSHQYSSPLIDYEGVRVTARRKSAKTDQGKQQVGKWAGRVSGGTVCSTVQLSK